MSVCGECGGLDSSFIELYEPYHGALEQLTERAPGEVVMQPGTMETVTLAIEPVNHALYIRRLIEAGVTIEDRTPFTIYLRDPDGRRVGLSSYPAELEALSLA